MQGFKKIVQLIRPYHGLVLGNILCNVGMAFFTVISIPAIIPFFEILFGLKPEITVRPELSFNNALELIRWQFTHWIDQFGSQTALLYVCLTIIILFLAKNTLRYFSMFFIAPVRTGVVRDLRNQLFDHLLVLPISFYTQERRGDLLTRISADVTEIEHSILSVLEALFREPIIIVGSVLFMVYISPMLTLFVFVLIIFTTFIIGGVAKALRRTSRVAQNKLGSLMSAAEESLHGIRIIKAFNGTEYVKNNFRTINEGYRRSLNHILWRRDLSSPLSEFLGILVVTVLMWYGSNQVFEENIQPQTFIAFLLAFFYVINPAKAFSSAYYNLQKGLAAMDRVEAVLSTANPITNAPHPTPVINFRHQLEFKQVSFRYKDELDWVLKDISFVLPKGRSLAIVGASGAGKSTLVDLIPRFYDVTSGAVCIDGVDIRQLDLNDLRGLTGVVTQEPILFNDSVYNNIVFGKVGVSPEQVYSAAKLANAHEFITALDQGYDTSIGDRGMKLSGGQRQRLTIARAILRDPQLLIFDEATSALDSESEKQIQEAMRQLMQARTTIIIAHRLSTIQYAEEIIVLKDGRIVERGDHMTLSRHRGEYYKFLELQSL